MKEYLSSLKKEFYNDENDYTHHIKLYEEKQEEIETWFSDEDSSVALFAFKLAIIKYSVSLIKIGEYKKAETYLLKIESKFRAYSHSEDKQKLLEFFQYYLAYSHYTTGEYSKSKQAFEILIDSKPDVDAYKTAWKENERKITKKNANAFMLIGLILAVVGWVTDMSTDAHAMRYLLYAGIAIIGVGGIYSYLRNTKLS